MTTNTTQISKEEADKRFHEWSQKEYVKISKFCTSKGYQIKKIDQPRCQLLPPALGIWLVETSEKNTNLWVISGDFPTDLVDSKVAANARDVLRHFSMSWHMQAAKLEQGVAEGHITIQDEETQTKLAQQLTSRAESLYDIYSNDELWKNSQL